MAKKRRGSGEGSVHQTRSGRWCARYRATLADGRKVRRYLYADSRKEVAQRLTKALAQRDRNAGVVADDSLTVTQHLDTWLANTKGSVKETTFIQYERVVRARIKPGLGHHKLTKLGPHHLAAYYQQRLDAGEKPATTRLTHAVLHHAFSKALRWGLVHRNVAELVTPPQARPPEIKPLNREQAHALLAAAEADDLEALYVILLTAGPRIGEALALQWSDVNLDAATLRVARNLYWAKGGVPRYSTPKNGKGRSITLTARAVDALRRHRIRQAELRLAAGEAWVDNDLAFSTSVGTPLRRENVYRKSFQPLLQRAGLPKNTRLHDLRHSCATLLLQQGTHPGLVQHLLGHASVSLTLDRYSHWTPSMGEQTAAAMDAALS